MSSPNKPDSAPAGDLPRPLPPDLFTIPVLDRWLLYAPRQHLAAFVPHETLQQLRHPATPGASAPALAPRLASLLARNPEPEPAAREGPLGVPLFLGLVPTRGCQMDCPYCDFRSASPGTRRMSTHLARTALDAYFDLVRHNGGQRADIHFFGGEPFHAPDLVRFAVEYATLKADADGWPVHFEATTNGAYPERLARWIGDHFSAAVLSLDGPPDIQDRQRPGKRGRPLSALTIRTAKVLSDAPLELILRTCVTAATVPRLPEIADWMAREFTPSTVCFESLHASPTASALGLHPPDPWQFAEAFHRAALVLARSGIEAVLSTADTRSLRAGFCPVGKDALIVSPDAAVDACYLQPADWTRSGLNLRLGSVSPEGFRIDPKRLRQARQLTVHGKRRCRDCFCRYHCCGGCHVHHHTDAEPGEFDSQCVQTRLVTLLTLLRRMGHDALAERWLASPDALHATVRRQSDRLEPTGFGA